MSGRPRVGTIDESAAHEIVIPAGGGVVLPGLLTLPEDASGVVAFAHGSGSSRFSPRNVAVAHGLEETGLATLLFDLLTDVESLDRANVFDIALLARRLSSATRWLLEEPATASLPIGYFGASTGAAAALWAASEHVAEVHAVVSRGGRPDLAAPRLPLVEAPTLLVVGGLDDVVLELNRSALRELRSCVGELAIVPGASHLFEESGTLERVTDLAAEWFGRHLPPAGPA